MRKSLYLLSSLVLVASLGAGCAGPEAKFGRGVGNIGEVARGGEFVRSVEQAGLFEGTDVGIATGTVRGINRTLARTGVGIYEIITAPLPPYGPIWTDYLSPKPLYSDGFHPRKWADSMFASDQMMGFSGGDIFPYLPNCRFRVFDE